MVKGGVTMGGASTSDTNEIGSKIRFFRNQKDWTQEVLAAEAGTSASAICRIESGKRKPNADLLCRIAKALGCELSDFQPESVYNSAEYESEIDEVLSSIKHIYRGADPHKQTFILNQLQALAGSYVVL